MPKLWESPIYKFPGLNNQDIVIDVTSSCKPGQSPHQVIYEMIKRFKANGVREILDFGAGDLRYAIPLLKAKFNVCAVEFEEQFSKPSCKKALDEARNRYEGLSTLVWPVDFLKDRRKFDAALLCYVLQVMPLKSERYLVLEQLGRKLRPFSYLLYMSRFHQMEGTSEDHRVSDGYYKWPERSRHSFYREFETKETHEMIKGHGFEYIEYLSERGDEQVFLYKRQGGGRI